MALNCTPLMTGASSPSPYKVTDYGTIYGCNGWLAFSSYDPGGLCSGGWGFHVDNLESNPLHFVRTTEAWVELDFGSKTTVREYSVATRDGYGWLPFFYLEGDGEILHTRNLTEDYTLEKRFVLPTPGNYRRYRLVVYGVWYSGGSYLTGTIKSIKFFC